MQLCQERARRRRTGQSPSIADIPRLSASDDSYDRSSVLNSLFTANRRRNRDSRSFDDRRRSFSTGCDDRITARSVHAVHPEQRSGCSPVAEGRRGQDVREAGGMGGPVEPPAEPPGPGPPIGFGNVVKVFELVGRRRPDGRRRQHPDAAGIPSASIIAQ